MSLTVIPKMSAEEYHRHEITLDLNNTAFRGVDLDDVRPAFEDPGGNCRPVKYVWQWAPSAEGPASYRLIIDIATLVGLVGHEWFALLAKDMYGWAKSNLGAVFSRRSNGDGWTAVKFADKTVYIDFHPSSDLFADAWIELADRFDEVKDSDLKRMFLTQDSDGKWIFMDEKADW